MGGRSMSQDHRRENFLADGHCPRCREWKLYPEKCRCQRFEVSEPWQDKVEDGQWGSVYAVDAEEAAEKFAETSDCDSGEYSIIRAGSGEIWTRDKDGNIQKWGITAEAVPTYSAREKRS